MDSGRARSEKKRGNNLTTATVHECSAVTSGTYERFLEINGKNITTLLILKLDIPLRLMWLV